MNRINVNRNAVWIVKWSEEHLYYTISRFSEPGRIVAHDYFWEDAITNLDKNYPEWELVIIRRSLGSVNYVTNPLMEIE